LNTGPVAGDAGIRRRAVDDDFLAAHFLLLVTITYL